MWRKVSLLIAVIFLSFPLCSVYVSAWEPEDAESGFFDLLPPLVKDEIGEEYPSAEAYGIDYYITYLAEIFSGEKDGFISLFFTIILLVFLSAVTANLSGRSAGAVGFLLSAVTASVLYAFSRDLFSEVEVFLHDTSAFGEGILPIMTALYAAGGNTATAVSSGGSIALFLSLTAILGEKLLFPLIRVIFIFSLVGEVGVGVDLSGFSDTLRKTYTYFVGLFGALFSFSLAAQGLLSSSADSLSARSVRFLIGQMIPIVGGTVSSAYGTLASGITYLRSAIGGTAVVAILLISLPVLLRILLMRLCLSVGKSAARLVSADRAGRVFSDFLGIYDMLFATVALVLVAFILLSVAFAKCAAAVA